MLEINGVELEFDILDADIAERYSAAGEELQAKLQELDLETLSDAEALRQECYLVFDYFDEIFGEGTAKAIFKERTNLGRCLDAMDQLAECATAQRKVFNEKMGKYKPNRAQRRAKA